MMAGTFRSQIAKLRKKYESKLTPSLEGFADRFTIFLPILSETGDAFTRTHTLLIHDLLMQCCGGCSQTRDDNGPPWQGEWRSPSDEATVDYHVLIVAYAKYNAADRFFERLKNILEQKDVAGQEVVMIEKITVQFVRKIAD